jgi:hypothetical protein
MVRTQRLVTAAERGEGEVALPADDAFISDWGEADGRVNTIILPWSDRAEAEIVATNARSRDEQRNVRIIDRKPAPPLVWSTAS